MSISIDELLRKYARLGWEHWNERTSDFKKMVQKKIGVEIADSQWNAEKAATNPFRLAATNGNRMKLIPMPCMQKNIAAAFFIPWTARNDQSELCFDMVVLLDQGSPCTFAFRFEPASQDCGSTHKYDHMQLSNSLCQRQIPLSNALTHLPSSYPALPIPGKEPVTRFLAMIVSMHGYPSDVNEIFNRAFYGELTKSKRYQALTRKILEVRGS